jgi:hypothetical protein
MEWEMGNKYEFWSKNLKATEAAGTSARREQSGDAVGCSGNKMAVRIQWRDLVGKTMKQLSASNSRLRSKELARTYMLGSF